MNQPVEATSKKLYQSPKLTIYGTVQAITKAQGFQSATDAILDSDGNIIPIDPGPNGSRDIILP